MKSTSFKDLGPDRIKDIRDEGWGQIEFIEVVFREWVKLNQSILDKEYTKQNGVARNDDDLDRFSLWLVDNIYLQVYCKRNDNIIVKELCVKYFDYQDGTFSQN
tara:strand:- start:187 stop:498 length:312 start_codon:yes stop_codon:yes gene_type:complete